MENIYMSLPYDLSGSISKNRFRQEILWGLSRIYEVYNSGKDFLAVFDYISDIEIHYLDSIEFYQIKAHNNPIPYTITKILKTDKKENSILGKLYKCKNGVSGKLSVLLAIVSNTPFKDKESTYTSERKKGFITLCEKSKTLLTDSLKKELEIDEVDLQDVYYIYTSMDLIHPKDVIIGKTIAFFIENMGCEPKKITALYQMLYDTICEKACYELKCEDYDSVRRFKSIDRSYIMNTLVEYKEHTDISVEKTKDYIENNFNGNFIRKLSLRTALSSVYTSLLISKSLQEIEQQIRIDIEKNKSIIEGKTEIEICNDLCDKYSFEPIYDNDQRFVFILLVLKRMEEGI